MKGLLKHIVEALEEDGDVEEFGDYADLSPDDQIRKHQARVKAIINVIIAELKAVLGIKDEVMMYHFEHETLHIGENLAKLSPGFISVYPSIPGLMEAFVDKRVARSQQRRGFFDLGRGMFQPGEIVYMYGY